MGIPLAIGFDVGSPIPLDSRDVVATIAARDAIPAGRRYQGMAVHVLDDGTGSPMNFQLIGGIADINWLEFAGGGSGGSGVGSDEVLFSYNFEDMVTADLATTFDVLDLGTGGVTVIDEVSPIHGTKSVKVTHPTSFANTIGFNALPIPLKFRGKTMRLSFDVKSDAAAGKIGVELYDNTNSNYLASGDDVYPTYDNVKSTRFYIVFTPPSNCLTVYLDITFTAEAGGKITFIDDCKIEAVDPVLAFGSGDTTDAIIEAKMGLGLNNPKIKYDNALAIWMQTNDGTTWTPLGASGLAAITITADYTVSENNSVLFAYAASGAIVISLPTAIDYNMPIRIQKTDATTFTVAVAPDGSETINGESSYVLYDQYNSITLISNGSSWSVF
jgi:hypothetical protein